MNLDQDFCKLTFEQLISMIKRLNRENSLLRSDLIKYKLLSNSFHKYFDVFNEINETIASKFDSNNEVLDIIKDIKLEISFTQKKEIVSINKLSKNSLNETNVENIGQNANERQELIERSESIDVIKIESIDLVDISSED